MPDSTLYKIAAIPGDGIGVDITDAAKKVLDKLAAVNGTFHFEYTTFDWSSKAYKERGWYMPPDWAEQLKRHDAIYFGAVGWPDVPDHISLWNMILPIRQEMSQYVNVRPTRILRGTQAPVAQLQKRPQDLDWIIIRENSEGEYAGQGGTTHGHAAHAIATEVAIFTRVGIERIMRFAFETAKSRPRKRLTMVTKSNAQRHGMVLWDKVFYEVAKEYEGVVEHDKMLVDAMTVRMVNRPESMDTIVATNRELSLHLVPCSPYGGQRSADRCCSARRHPVRPCRGSGRLHWYRAIFEPRPNPFLPIYVRAYPWFSSRYCWQRYRESSGRFLVCSGDGTMVGKRKARHRRGSAHECHRECDWQP